MPHQRWTAGETRPKLDQFLKPVLRAARLDLDYQLSAGGGDQKFITPDLTVSFEGKDIDLLLAHKGELLLAIEHLCLEAMGVSHADRYRLIFDARDYRIMRIDELCLSAETAAEKVKRTGIPFKFHPMTSRERRIIHLALRDDPDVDTASEGVPPHRHAIVRAAEKH